MIELKGVQDFTTVTILNFPLRADASCQNDVIMIASWRANHLRATEKCHKNPGLYTVEWSEN